MLFLRHQHFLLLIALIGISACSTDKALSRSKDSRLNESKAGSHLIPANFLADKNGVEEGRGGESLPQVDHGKGIIAKDSSSVLDIDERIKVPGNSDSDRQNQDDRNQTRQKTDGEAQYGSSSDNSNTMSGGEQSGAAVENAGAENAGAESRNQSFQKTENLRSSDIEDTTSTRIERRSVDDQFSRPTKTSKRKKRRNSNDETVGQNPITENGQLIEESAGYDRQNQPNSASANKSREEVILKNLVKELEYGSLGNSILLLKRLTTEYPDDPDYRALLARALQLRDGDVWYDYQRRTAYKEKKNQEKDPEPEPQIIKPVANPGVNALKRESWFLMRSVKRP